MMPVHVGHWRLCEKDRTAQGQTSFCRPCLILLILIASIVALGCSSDHAAERSPSGTHETLLVKPSLAMADVFEETSTITYEIGIFNHGSRVVRIVDVLPSCSCTIAKLSDPIIRPGRSVALEVAYNVVSQLGELAKRKIVIKTDDPDYPVLQCEVGGFRHQRYDVDPVAADFGQIEVGQAASTDLTIEAFGPDNRLVCDRAIATSPFVSIVLLDTSPTRSGTRYHVRVSLSEAAPLGPFEARLFVPREKDDGIGPQPWIRAQITGPVRLEPPIAFLGVLQRGGEAARCSVRLLPAGLGDKAPSDGQISQIRLGDLPDGIVARSRSDDAGAIEIVADPKVLPPGAFDREVIVTCRVGRRECRMQLKIRGLVSE